MPNTCLSTKDPSVNKTDTALCPQGAYIPELINNKFPGMLKGNKCNENSKSRTG